MARLGIHDAVSPDIAGDMGKTRDNYGGDAFPLQRPGQRSPAARTRPSRRRKNDPRNVRSLDFFCPGTPNSIHGLERPTVAAGT